MKGHRVSLATRARAAGLSYGLVANRIHAGWSIDRALSTPEPDYAAAEDRNAKARVRTIQKMAEREAAAAEREADERLARIRARARARARALTHARPATAEAIQRDMNLYSPRHVTTREPLAGPPPWHQAPIEATLADDLISQFADTLAVADAETYDAAFDPDFDFVPGNRRTYLYQFFAQQNEFRHEPDIGPGRRECPKGSPYV